MNMNYPNLRPVYTSFSTFLLAGAILAGCATATVPAAESAAQMEQPAAAQESTSAEATVADGVKFNINIATEEEFLTIPGVGEKMADEFMEYRPFVSIAQFRKDMSKYVDDAQIAAYEEYLFVPVSANDSDSATLQQLPGVDEAIAEQLIAGRPYDSDDAFMDALADIANADAATAAATMMDMGEMAEMAESTDHVKLNINMATEEELLTIPDVGEKMVDEFMEYRPFVSIAQFRKDMSKYVDDTQIAEYEEYLFVPVNPNESDAATLQQLPDVDESNVEALISGRPYDSNAAFLTALADYMSESEVEEASHYLEVE